MSKRSCILIVFILISAAVNFNLCLMIISWVCYVNNLMSVLFLPASEKVSSRFEQKWSWCTDEIPRNIWGLWGDQMEILISFELNYSKIVLAIELLFTNIDYKLLLIGYKLYWLTAVVMSSWLDILIVTK